MTEPVAIVGAGLSGLYLAWQLQQHDIPYQLFESDQRLGGRILSRSGCDLGPTWYWPDEHRFLAMLIQKLQLETLHQWQKGQLLFQEGPQQLRKFPDPQGYGHARRIRGGAQVLVESLQSRLDASCIHRGHHLAYVSRPESGVELLFEISSGKSGEALNDEKLDGEALDETSINRAPLKEVHASQVVLTLPPRLLAGSLMFTPPLEPALMAVCAQTPTWMAGNAKAVAVYEQPFWHQQGLSGNSFASYPGAVLGEIFDASDSETGLAALGGFITWPPEQRQADRENLQAKVIEQLTQLFGGQAASPAALHIYDWYQQPRTAVKADNERLTTHPQYGHRWLQMDYWHDRLFFSASETDSAFGGYMEGAIRAAQRTFEALLLTRQSQQYQTA